MGIKRAKMKEVRRVTAAELAADGAAVVQLERVSLPQKQKSRRFCPALQRRPRRRWLKS